jgi:DNA end-binding protein Ku
MAARSIASGSISFGLVSIPVKLFPATSSKAVGFNLLHEKDKSRIQQKIYCPVDDAIVDRSELVRGFQVEKGRYVTFTDEELKSLEARGDHTIEISEFIPLSQVDPVYFEEPYYLGCEQTSAKAYHLLAEAMAQSERVALAQFTMRGKEHLVLIRPHEKGLILHTMYYADEVRSVADVDRGLETSVKEGELELAERLIGELTSKKFDPTKYQDRYRERVLEAAEKKIQGEEITEAPPEARKAQVIDLMSALKASLEKRGAAKPAAAEAPDDKASAKSRSVSRSTRTTRERRTAGGKK